MPKTEKTHQTVFDEKIIPILDKLIKLCNKSGIPMQFTAQLTTDEKPKIVTESLYTEKSNKLFQIIDQLSHGTLSVIPLPDDEFYLAIKENTITINNPKLIPLVLPFSGQIH